jgi:hypothetical protein
MAFGQDFLKTFFGNDYLKDYRHASKTFASNGYENSPRFKYLFHVYFHLNTVQIPQLKAVLQEDQSTIGLLVKNVELPRYRIATETLNQYNRKRVVQTKIEYQPIKMALHDDGGDLIRTLWYNYYAYYYKDASQKYLGTPNTNGTPGPDQTTPAGFDYNARDIYDADRTVNDWGYIGESYQDVVNNQGRGGKPPFFRDISIYGFNQHKFVEYVLVNPLISEWNHDTYDYSEDTGIMENTMTVNYETVKYYSGAIGGSRPATYVQGFADPAYYDQVQSPLSRPGGTRSILGQGGLLDTGIGIIGDLQSGSVAGVIGAVQKAGTAYGTFRGADLVGIAKEEVLAGARDALRNDLPAAARSQGTQGLPSIAQRLNQPIFPTPGG